MSNIYKHVHTFDIPKEILEAVNTDMNSEEVPWEPHQWTRKQNDGSLKVHTRNDGEELFVKGSNIDISFSVSKYCLSKANEIYKFLNLQHTNFVRYNEYRQGTNMALHWDRIHSLFDGQKKGVPVVSIVGVTSLAEEGGEFVFIDKDGTETEFLTRENTFVIFPSTFLYRHKVTSVTKGVRRSFVAWAY
jgi:hypothetical protein